jgi:hypothetical protein
VKPTISVQPINHIQHAIEKEEETEEIKTTIKIIE